MFSIYLTGHDSWHGPGRWTRWDDGAEKWVPSHTIARPVISIPLSPSSRKFRTGRAALSLLHIFSRFLCSYSCCRQPAAPPPLLQSHPSSHFLCTRVSAHGSIRQTLLHHPAPDALPPAQSTSTGTQPSFPSPLTTRQQSCSHPFPHSAADTHRPYTLLPEKAGYSIPSPIFSSSSPVVALLACTC